VSTKAPTSPTVPATATAAPAGYSLPGCYVPGQNKCNCSNFTTQAYAQWFHDNYDPVDVNGLDGSPKNGIVCESLP